MAEQVSEIGGLKAYEINFQVGRGRKINQVVQFHPNSRQALAVSRKMLEEAWAEDIQILSINETTVTI